MSKGRRGTFARFARRVVVFGVLGVVVSYLVAWGCGTFVSGAYDDSTRERLPVASGVPEAIEAMWMRGLGRGRCSVASTCTLSVKIDAPLWESLCDEAVPNFDWAAKSEPVGYHYNIFAYGYGWPVVSHVMVCVARVEVEPGFCGLDYSGPGPEGGPEVWEGARVCWPGYDSWFAKELKLWGWTCDLAFRPLWPGLAINAALYAVLLWLLRIPLSWAAGLIGRGVRRIRRRRGLCVGCGYDLRGRDSAGGVCPECGGGQ